MLAKSVASNLPEDSRRQGRQRHRQVDTGASMKPGHGHADPFRRDPNIPGAALSSGTAM